MSGLIKGLRWILSILSLMGFAMTVMPIFFTKPSLAKQGAYAFSPFAISKWHVDDQQALQEGELVVVVNNNCLQTMSLENPQAAPLSVQMAERSERHHQLSTQAYTISIENEEELSDVADMVANDHCLNGVVNNHYLEATDLTDDPRYDSQDYMRTIASEGSHDLFWRSSLAIDLAVGEEVVIAVVDTGIDRNHEDLQTVLWNDGQGNFGFDFVNNDNDPNDDEGHGTHVAGLAAAKASNNVGITGVMGFSAKLMGVKVLNAAGGGNLADIVNGINYAAENGADVINLSLGGTGAIPAMQDALARAVNMGSVVMVAAGNNGFEISNGNPYSPAGYARGIDGAISVGSIDASSRRRSGFSNFSTDFVEIAAPGSGPAGILSTYPGNNYNSLSGTSMATPIVAGAGALIIGFLRKNNIEVTPALVEEILMQTAIQDPDLSSVFAQGRRLDLQQIAEYLESSLVMAATGGVNEIE